MITTFLRVAFNTILILTTCITVSQASEMIVSLSKISSDIKLPSGCLEQTLNNWGVTSKMTRGSDEDIVVHCVNNPTSNYNNDFSLGKYRTRNTIFELKELCDLSLISSNEHLQSGTGPDTIKVARRVIVEGKEGIMLTGFHPILEERPRLIVVAEDKDKRSVRLFPEKKDRTYKDLVKKLEPYIEQHLKDPDYLMSRMPMQWGQGKHYTSFPAYTDPKSIEYKNFDSEHAASVPVEIKRFNLDLRNRSGNAPVPTIRVGFDGVKTISGERPAILKLGEMEAYNGDLFCRTDRSDPNVKSYIPLDGASIHKYLRDIAELATNSALLYFWTDEEKYAKFACDYLMQFAMGIYFQNPFNHLQTDIPVFLNKTGLNGMDIDASFLKVYAYVYDICYDYLQKNERHYLSGDFYPHRKGEIDKARLQKALKGKKINDVVDQAFFKFAYEMILSRVLLGDIDHPNNHCIWSQQCVDFLLAIEDDELRARGMDVIAYSDEMCKEYPAKWGGKAYFGSYPIDLQVKTGYTADGFWKEAASYSMIAKGRIINLLRTLDRHGYDSWKRNFTALKSSEAQFRLMFPNHMLAAFGNSSSWEQKESDLTEMYLVAKKYGMSTDELVKMGNGVKWAIDNGFCKPLSDEDMKDLPKEPKEFLPRTDFVDFVPFYLQRNGALDVENGLLSTMYCGNYTHLQPEGINIEVYGKGFKMVPHNGYGGYGSKLHKEYNERIGCKNTVIPGGLPLTMKDMATNKYNLQLYAMEPMPLQDAVSPSMSFLETTLPYGGRQRRNMALIRTSDTSGFYVDIFRSSNPESNEYRLYSIGQNHKVYDGKIAMFMEEDHGHRDKMLGDHFLKERKMSTSKLKDNLHVVFDINDTIKNLELEFNVHMLGREEYKVYTATGHPRGAAHPQFNKLRAPAFFVDIKGEAWSRPFISVFEAVEKGDRNINTINRLSDGFLTALEIEDKSGEYLVMSAESPDRKNKCKGWDFRGTFAVVKQSKNSTEIYLGKGTYISNGKKIQISTKDGKEFSASLRINDKKAVIKSNANCEISYKGKVFSINANETTEL